MAATAGRADLRSGERLRVGGLDVRGRGGQLLAAQAVGPLLDVEQDLGRFDALHLADRGGQHFQPARLDGLLLM